MQIRVRRRQLHELAQRVLAEHEGEGAAVRGHAGHLGGDPEEHLEGDLCVYAVQCDVYNSCVSVSWLVS